ncbi:NapC/NirT cytochrome c family, N-terminal region [Bryocella elongata]|uniref:NapC/NirT cytochrome c family, N-terminal region n=1 Tax=Bryocella elongata TaxID=863522 RepID=A0A1H5S0D6_9BACT|nr:NapC/NirT family cytochrome c [Bryocella elongata]SEF44083.1 NapC/NirT cytochrome c family, N-terminal region [Bryocella elongata]
MPNAGSFRENWLRPFFFYGNNWLSLIGGAITTASAMVLAAFWVISVFGHGGSSNPYLGILFDLLLPGVFVLGLVLILVGILIRRSYLLATDQVPSFFPEVSLQDPAFRHGLEIVAVATIVNFIIVGVGCYRGVAYMDTVSFCGQTCHVMAPENAAYHVSSHSGVACTECHVAPGAAGYVHAKVNGTKQLFMVVVDHYPKPIMADSKVPAASATCLHCHNAHIDLGDKLLIHKAYADDSSNTQTTSLTLLHVGGQDVLGHLSGIHGAHMGRIEYMATDSANQTIPWVRKTNSDGSTTDFVAAGAALPSSAKPHVMDCIDCHNRAAHSFDTAQGALDRMMAQGSPSASLPFLHKEALTLLNAKYDSQTDAKTRISSGLITFYRSQYPSVWDTHRAQVEGSAAALVKIYSTNVFPSMKVTWGTHPNNIGHNDSPGCFRCHDGSHTSKTGQTITNDCSTCHNLVVSNEPHPKLLADLGMR